MIPNQWYAILSSDQIKSGKAVGVRRFSENLLLFRDENGQPGCVSDLCAHRGASLAKGCVRDGHIRCPFHGIEYDITGRCVHIPSEGRIAGSDFERFHLRSMPVREIGGIVFVWYGDGEPTGDPDVFDVLTDGSYAYDEMQDLWQVHYSRVIENQLDVSHLPFVHHNTIGRGGRTLVNGPHVEWLDDHTLRTSADNETDKGQRPKSAEESAIKSTNLTFKFPNLWLNHVTDKLLILAYFIPVDEERSIIALRFYNRFTGCRPLNRLIARLGSVANRIVERQDKRIVETQLPRASALYMNESLVAADLPIMEYRGKREELQKRKEANMQQAPLNLSTETDNKAMYRLSYGLFVLTVKEGDKLNGCITNTAIQAASTPNQLVFCVNKANLTHEMLVSSRRCNLSVISEAATFDLFKRFGFQSGRDADKFAGFAGYRIADNGIPVITEGTNALFSLEIRQMLDLGSHTLFVGEPAAMQVLSDAPSATYAYYQEHVKPRPEAVGKTPEGQTIWRCKICGYEYVGEELPEDFICPICKHPASDFERVG